MNAPIFLDNYDPITELIKWKSLGDQGPYRPAWELRSYAWDNVVCRLSWSFGTQMGGLEKIARTAKEAVYLALTEWLEWKAKYEARKGNK